MKINYIVNKNDKFLNIDILLSLYSHYFIINNILSLNISKTILYLLIYNFSKIKSCYLSWFLSYISVLYLH